MEKTIDKTRKEKLSIAMERYVRQKAINAGGTIYYLEGENIVNENPATGVKKIVRKSSRSKFR